MAAHSITHATEWTDSDAFAFVRRSSKVVAQGGAEAERFPYASAIAGREHLLIAEPVPSFRTRALRSTAR
jgi:hypothetical protein